MIIDLLAGIFLLGFCVFFHELGHFLAGKLVGVRPKIFSIGYGKGRITKVVGDTTYQITAIPLGGYVQFYGDDITQTPDKIEPGDFFSVNPWKRIIIAAGGPVFSLLLGVIIIFILHFAGWQPISNEVQPLTSLQKISSEKYPAEGYLKSGDRIISVNENSVKSFEEINYHIALSPSDNIALDVERENKIYHFNIKAISTPGIGIPQIGIQPLGNRYLIVDKAKDPFQSGDKIIKINDISINNFITLKNTVNHFIGQTVEVVVLRKSNFFSQVVENIKKENEVIFKASVESVEVISFENIVLSDSKKVLYPLLEVTPNFDKKLKSFNIAGETYDNWEDFKKAITYHLRNTNTLRFYIEGQKDEVEATVKIGHKGMLGILLTESLEPKKANLPVDFLSLIQRTFEQSIFAAKSSIMGLYRMIQGRLSFRENVSGPIKIVDYARQSVSAGWDVYWFLLANITIILGIMNLLPIPVLDGGHIVFYFIEGIYKPIPTKYIAMSIRLGMVILLTFGISVLFLDIWDVIIKRIIS